MLVIGTDAANPRKLLAITESDLLYHMAVIGQSGSGKSYFIARLLEEITLRTRKKAKRGAAWEIHRMMAWCSCRTPLNAMRQWAIPVMCIDAGLGKPG